MKRGGLVLCAVVSFLIFGSTQLMAQEGKIRVGKLKVIPGIKVQGIHDDNIYLGNGTNNTTELKESDWITHFMPSVLLDYAFDGRGSMKFGYQGDWARYSDNDKNNWNTQRGLFALDYKAPAGIILGINNIYTDAEDPYGSDNQYKLGTPMTKRWNNDLKTRLGYQFSDRFKVLGYFNTYKQDYEALADWTQNYDSREFGGGLEMKLLPKTWGFIRYHYGEQDYYSHPLTVAGVATNSTEANDADSDWQRVNVGLSWDPGAKLSGELNFGYQWKDYENRADPTGDLYGDENNWVASTALSYTPTTTTTLSLSITRSVKDTAANDDDRYTDTGIGIDLRQMLMTKFTLTAGFSLGKNDYKLPLTNPRSDDNYIANMGLEYKIQEWLSASVGYTYNKKDSNYVDNDYTDNQFMISLSGSY
ncbi:MAG: outer membrane beta-barrel protein [Pseudomonadota bacterium]